MPRPGAARLTHLREALEAVAHAEDGRGGDGRGRQVAGERERVALVDALVDLAHGRVLHDERQVVQGGAARERAVRVVQDERCVALRDLHGGG